MGADVLATQEARASTTVIFTMLNQINSVPERMFKAAWLLKSPKNLGQRGAETYIFNGIFVLHN